MIHFYQTRSDFISNSTSICNHKSGICLCKLEFAMCAWHFCAFVGTNKSENIYSANGLHSLVPGSSSNKLKKHKSVVKQICAIMSFANIHAHE